MALNSIHTQINRLQTTDFKDLGILYFFIRVVISVGDKKFACLHDLLVDTDQQNGITMVTFNVCKIKMFVMAI